MKTFLFLTHTKNSYELKLIGVRDGESGKVAYGTFIKECPEVLKKSIDTIFAIETAHKNVWGTADRFSI